MSRAERATKLGIGITTYNRCESLRQCLTHVQRYTRQPFHLIVADDGSNDETANFLRQENLALVTGSNRGVIWNKNRALFILHHIVNCDVIILLEDDCYPTEENWQAAWVNAARGWGHANLAGRWFRQEFLGGSGTVEDPIISQSTSGQCAAFSREALLFCGFMDTRFKGYGFGHIEHSQRMVRSGYGGLMRLDAAWKMRPHDYLLAANLKMLRVGSFRSGNSIQRNAQVFKELRCEPLFRNAWSSDAEREQFRCEIRSACPELVPTDLLRRSLVTPNDSV